MKSRHFLSLVVFIALSGCESDLNRGLVHNDRTGQTPTTGVSAPGRNQTPGQSPKAGPDLASLSPGLPCRVDLIRPAGEGQAYQGTVVRVEDKAVVLSNVYSEGPSTRQRSPNLNDVMDMRMPWSPPKTTIDWQRLPDKEFRVAKSEIAAVKILDHDPVVDYYAR